MPQAPRDLQLEWQTDAIAMDFLESSGFTLTKRWTWKAPHRDLTAEEYRAIDYLIMEWDFGGLENDE